MRRIAVCLLTGAILSLTGNALAETELVEKNGWKFFVDGRINAFASLGVGDSYPEPPLVDPDGPGGSEPASTYTVAGGSGFETKQDSEDGKYFGVRVRNGFVGNIFGFGFDKQVTGGTKMRGYMSIWSTIETSSRNKYVQILPDVREGYVKFEGGWGSFLAGRTLGLFGLGSVQQDGKYLHNWGLGHPCESAGLDNSGPTCGQIGQGVMFPGFAAGFVYSTPRAAGLALSAGIYDPAIFAGTADRTPLPRPEAELSFDMPLGANGNVHAFVSALWQKLGADRAPSSTDVEAYGVAGGASLEIGPLRLAGSAFYGPGLGFGIALDNTPASVKVVMGEPELHTFDGFFGVVGAKFGQVELGVGAGMSRMHLLEVEKADQTQSMPKSQFGISAMFNYHFTDYLVGDVDYFRAKYDWYLGDTQTMNFLNAGLTVHW